MSTEKNGSMPKTDQQANGVVAPVANPVTAKSNTKPMLFLSIGLGLLGLILIIVGVVIKGALSDANKTVRNANAVCKNDQEDNNEQWTTFLNNKSEVDKQRNSFQLFNIFDIQNGKAWQEGGDLEVKVYGPYAFKRYTARTNTSWASANGFETIKTTSTMTSAFDAAKTKELGCKGPDGKDCTADDKVVNVNPIMLGAAKKGGSDTNVSLASVSTILKQITSPLPICQSIRGMSFKDAVAGGGKAVDGVSALAGLLKTGGLWSKFGWPTVNEAHGATFLETEMKKVNAPKASGSLSEGQGWLFNYAEALPNVTGATYKRDGDKVDPLMDPIAKAAFKHSFLEFDQGYCACDLIVKQADATDPNDIPVFMGTALAYQNILALYLSAKAAHEAAPSDAVKKATYEGYKQVFDATKVAYDAAVAKNTPTLTNMIMSWDIKDNTNGTTAPTLCDGYTQFTTLFVTELTAQAGAGKPHTTSGKECHPLTDKTKTGSIACIEKVATEVYKGIFDKAETAHTKDISQKSGYDATNPAGKALTCTNTAPNPTSDPLKIDMLKCFLRIGGSVLKKSGSSEAEKTKAKTLIQSALVLHMKSPYFTSAFFNYWKRLAMLPASLIVAPASVPDANAAAALGATTDGLLIQKTVSEWYHGHASPVAKLTTSLDTPAYGTPIHGGTRGTPAGSVSTAVTYSGCDDDKNISRIIEFEDNSGDLVKSIKRAKAVTEVGFPSDGLPVDGFDGTLSPPMGYKNWYDGKKTKLTEYSAWVGAAYQALTLYPKGEMTCGPDKIKADKFQLKDDWLKASAERKKVYIGVQANMCADSATNSLADLLKSKVTGVYGSACGTPAPVTSVDGILDLKELKESVHATISSPLFMNAHKSVYSHLKLCDLESATCKTGGGTATFPAVADADMDKYRSYVGIERLTGRIIEAKLRYQVNTVVDKGYFPSMCKAGLACNKLKTQKNVPIYWTEISGELNPDLSQKIIDAHNTINTGFLASNLLFGFGGFFMFVSLIVAVYLFAKKRGSPSKVAPNAAPTAATTMV